MIHGLEHIELELLCSVGSQVYFSINPTNLLSIEENGSHESHQGLQQKKKRREEEVGVQVS
ncbi:hypothetical protein DVH24_005769 [Malus domestica]|uniref:Uncharacterized protein n=1 Tax=Malus domestica TaxID=3750 RepID=A0A498IJH9_MALDO|nr:hypothetical protein DVH24_005769 [Malus domestica]